MNRVASNNPIYTYTTYNKKYYTKDVDILHDLMDDTDLHIRLTLSHFAACQR